MEPGMAPDSNHSGTGTDSQDPWDSYGIVRKGNTVAILGLGDMLPQACRVADSLRERAGINATVMDPHQYSHPDLTTLQALDRNHRLVVTMEDGQLLGGWGQGIAASCESNNIQVLTFGADKEINDRVPLTTLNQRYRLNTEDMTDSIISAIQGRD